VSAASLLRLRLFPAAVLAGAVGGWAALAFASPPATGEAATFLVMWGLMVAAMMLPTILPLLGAHAALASGGTALVAAGYVLVWSGIGLVALVLSLLLAALVVAEKTTGWGPRLALPSGISLLVVAALVAAPWSPA